MESSTPLSSSSTSGNNQIAQDPLALPNEPSSLFHTGSNSSGCHETISNQERHELCGNLSATQSNTNLSDKENNLNENSLNNGAIYPNDITIKHEDDERRMQFDSNQIANNYSGNDPRKLNHHIGMHHQQQHLPSHHQQHEPHKTFSHSIENLSKTTEKCTPNEIKMYPNLIDSGHEYDDGYETGVGDLMSHKYKLPTLPPPSSSPYSSLSSSSMSTISTSTMTPTNLVNPQQQQSPSYLSGGAANGNAGNTMNHYQQQQQQQPQQYHQNQQQYQPMQHQNHMNSFNSYHPMFGNRPMQHQPMSNVIKNEQSMTSSVDNDPYRFVDEDLSNGMNTTGLHGAMHQNYQHMTSPTIMSGNYTTSSNLHQQQQQNPTNGNASMMQFNEHHHMSPHHNHLGHPQQIQSQHGMMNGNANAQNIGHAGMNPNMMMMNDTPKKRGRKKKLRDENGNPIEDNRPVKERKKHDRFNGMPEEEVTKRTIPDHITNNLDIIIIGINPGLFAAYKGHHYAGPGNHFWKCLYLSGLTSVQMTAEEDYKLLQYGIGFTNMVQRPTKGSADLTRKEIKEGSRILLEKIQKFQPKVAVFNGKLIFEVFSGKKDFCFGKQPETVEGTNTYMWVMPSSSARCAQLPRAADKVPFYAALKKFRDYLNGLVPEYDESEYVFNDPKYSQISTEAELKDDNLAFTTLENGEIILADPNKKKRGRPKKIRGENGEEIVTPSRRKNNDNQQGTDCTDDDPNKKKRGRPKKVKDGANASPATGKKKSNSNKDKLSQQQQQQQQSIASPMSGTGNDLSSLSHHQQSPSSQNPQLSSLTNNGSNSNTSTTPSFLPPIESPSASLNYQNNGAINQQANVQQSNPLQNTSPVNLCYPPATVSAQNIEQVQQSELTHNHVTYQQQRSVQQQQQQQIFSNNASPEITTDITTNNIADQITSPVTATSPNLPPSDFEPPEPTANNSQNTSELSHYSQQAASQALEQQSQHHHTQSPLAQSQSPLGVYPHGQSQQQQHQMMGTVNNSSIYSPYSRQQPTPQQSYMSMSQSPHHVQQQQQAPPAQIRDSLPNASKTPTQQQQQIGQQLNGSGTDLFKDVAAKSLSGLESLVDQIPNINEQDTGLSSLSSSAANVQLPSSDSYTNMISGYSPSGSSNLTPSSTALGSSSLLPPSIPHHHSHYSSYTSHANQPPYSANPFSVSSLTSSSYPAAAAMNSYHQNLMGTSHLTSSFMEPHMPVPVSPLYHSYQQQYPGYPAPTHPSAAAALHMANYPSYYTNTGYTQAPGSTYHSMFDRINF